MDRRISNDSLTMSATKDDEGFHYVKDRYCSEDCPYCFAFNGTGRTFKFCDFFRRGLNGAKICQK